MLYVLKILMTNDNISLFQVNISDVVKFSELKNKSLTLIYLHNINKDLDVNINFILLHCAFATAVSTLKFKRGTFIYVFFCLLR